MRISRWTTYAIGVSAAAALIAGCSSNGSGSAMQPGAVVPNSVSASGHGTGGIMPLHRGLVDAFIGAMPLSKVHKNHIKTWVSPAAKGAPRILFASDASYGVAYMYLLPSFKQVGTIGGLSEPQGECADNKGNVFIANTGTNQVYQFSRTGTLLATYNDSYGYPVGCAWDPSTGNLAVTDIFDFSSQAGDVLVYTSPSSTPTQLRNPNQYYYYFAGYDTSGNLWVSGKTSGGSYSLSYCGSSSCSTIPVSGGTVYFPGAVQWDGMRGQWVVFDQLCGDANAACSYPITDSGVLGAKTTYSAYNGNAVCDLIQGTIAANGKNYVAGGDYFACGFANSTFDRWGYTAGGVPTAYVNDPNHYGEPVGAAISTK